MSGTTINWTANDAGVMDAIGDILRAGDRAILATVIGVEGSAYRRPGAKMLVSESGNVVGHVTADCLEDSVRELASAVIETGDARVETFDLMGDDDTWGLGVGCNGVIDLLLEPITDVYRPPVEAMAAGQDIAVLTVLDGPHIGAHACFQAGDGMRMDDTLPDELGDELPTVAAEFLADGRSDTVQVDETTVFVDAMTSPPQLLVVGSGHDVAPIVTFGDRVGFDVHVVGYRGTKARADRFPAAKSVRSASPRELRTVAPLDEDTYAVVVTHNFIDDRLTVGELLDSPIPYIGLMGPPERFEEMQEAFGAEGRHFSNDELDRLYTPIGLDLGGETPTEVALSIVSEIQSVRHDRHPQHLSDRDGPIHERPRSI